MSRPDWLAALTAGVAYAQVSDFVALPPPAAGARPAAVLVLFGEQDGQPDLLVLQRASTLRNHAGQPAFPGGAVDPGDADPAATALREAHEEVGLDPSSVTVLRQLPELFLPVSSFRVTPVLGWWHAPHPVYPRQPGEVAHVARLPVADLVDPANRLRVRHPSGWVGAAFAAGDMLVWGFTAGIISVLLDLAGWARPWDQGRIIELPAAAAAEPATPAGAADEVIG